MHSNVLVNRRIAWGLARRPWTKSVCTAGADLVEFGSAQGSLDRRVQHRCSTANDATDRETGMGACGTSLSEAREGGLQPLMKALMKALMCNSRREYNADKARGNQNATRYRTALYSRA